MGQEKEKEKKLICQLFSPSDAGTTPALCIPLYNWKKEEKKREKKNKTTDEASRRHPQFRRTTICLATPSAYHLIFFSLPSSIQRKKMLQWQCTRERGY